MRSSRQFQPIKIEPFRRKVCMRQTRYSPMNPASISLEQICSCGLAKESRAGGQVSRLLSTLAEKASRQRLIQDLQDWR